MRALIVGCYDGKRLRFVGQVYAGLDKWSRRALTEQLTPLITNTCPFSNLPMRGRGQFDEGITATDMNAYQWLRPGVVVQIEFQEWTSGGLLRHPKFVGVRLDRRLLGSAARIASPTAVSAPSPPDALKNLKPDPLPYSPGLP